MTPEEEKRLLATVLRTDMSAPRAPSVNMMAGQQSGTSGPYMTPEQLAAATRSTAGKELGLKNQLVQANALRGAEAAKGKTVGPYDLYMGPNWGDMAASLGKQLTGGYMAGQANKGLEDLDEEVSKAQAAEAMQEEDVRKEGLRLAAANRAEDQGIAANEGKESGEWRVNGKPIRGYTQYGIAYDEDGNRLPEDAVEYNAPTRSSGSRYTMYKGKDFAGNDVVMRFDKQTGEETPFRHIDGSQYTEGGARELADLTTDVETDRAGSIKGAQEGAGSNQKAIDGLSESIPAHQKSIGLYNEAIQAIASGAETGPFAGRMPSFREASVWLDNVQQELGLSKIAQYTFGSLSEAEGNWVRESSIPQNMNEEYLVPFLEKKAEAGKRMLNALRFEREFREKFGKRPPDEMVDKIMYEGGFSYRVPKEWLKEEEK